MVLRSYGTAFFFITLGIGEEHKGNFYDSDDETIGCRIGWNRVYNWLGLLAFAFVSGEMASGIGYVAIILRGLILVLLLGTLAIVGSKNILEHFQCYYCIANFCIYD
jgi:hypothetical protein